MKTYTVEFKKQAVDLAVKSGNILKTAKELGLSDGNIHAWKKKFSPSNASSLTHLPLQTLEQEIVALKKENEKLKKINEILKQASAFFWKVP